MSAITTLILTMSVLMVLAVGGASSNAQISSEASDAPPSRIAINHNETMLGGSLAVGQAYTVADLIASIQSLVVSKPTSGGCDEWGCGSNHNETMLGGSLAIGQAYSVADSVSDLLASIQAFFGRPTSGGGGCDDWGCGTNHNETMLIVR